MKSAQFGLSPELLRQIFPFHIVLNRDLNWVQMGSVLERLLTPMAIKSTFLFDYFQIKRPKCLATFESLKKQTKSLFLLQSLHNEMQLKGQIVYIEASDVLMFLGTPWITEISHLKQLDLSIKDFPLYDSLGDYLFLLQGVKTALTDTQKMTARLKDQTLQLQSTTSRLTTLIESLQAGVLLEDEHGQIVLVNQAFCTMFGMQEPPAFFQGLDCWQLAQEGSPYFQDPYQFLTRIKEILKRQEILVNEEIKINDGRTFERDYIPIVIGNVYRGHLWLYRDISERKQIQFQLEKAKDLAESASSFKSQFLANMSHELRTPLNAIIGFAQLMDRNPDLSSQDRESVEIINRSGEHLLCLINNILEMTKIESGKILRNEDSFDLHRQLSTLEGMLKLKAQAKGLTLTFLGVETTFPYIKTDESKLRQVLINLLDNAIKFTERGEVTLRVSEDRYSRSIDNLGEPQSYNLFFEISDTGIGMTKHDLTQLFQPFVQTYSGQQSKQGTGLGLSISRKFVQLLGGDITVSSVLGVGTRFSFSIQVQPAQDQKLSSEQGLKRVIGLTPHQETFRLLVVDDILENRQLLSKLLVPLGFEVYEAENGQDAIALWEECSPHLIWLDMKMPVISGYETARYIKAQRKGQDAVIIALTASALNEELQEMLDAGCDDWVYKPFQANELFDKLTQHLNVQFIYDQKPEYTPLPSSNPVLTPEQIAKIMPREWIQSLNHAARSGDDEEILDLIRSIPTRQDDLIKELTDLANNFAFDRLQNLTQFRD